MKPKNYDDIIHTEYPFALRHVRMSISDRAAQFSGFKALSGLDAEIDESKRLTEMKADLDESAKEVLNHKLQLIKENLCHSNQPLVRITYFLPDTKKAGGEYISILARIKKVDENAKQLQTTSGLNISIEDISELEGEIFDSLGSL